MPRRCYGELEDGIRDQCTGNIINFLEFVFLRALAHQNRTLDVNIMVAICVFPNTSEEAVQEIQFL